MAPPPRPRPGAGKGPRAPRPDPGSPPPSRKPPIALLAGAGGGVVVLAVVLFIALGGKEEPPPTVVVEKPRTAEREIAVRTFYQDLGRTRQLTVFADAGKVGDYLLKDGAGKEYRPEAADPTVHFLRDYQKRGSGIAFSFLPPPDAETLELSGPGGKTWTVYRKPGPDNLRTTSSTPVSYEDWNITAKGTPGADGTFDLEISARPGTDSPEKLDPKKLLLVTDAGDFLAPEVKSSNPLKCRYVVPKTATELRLQTQFREKSPDYFVFRLASAPPPPDPKPDANAPKPDVKPPPAGGLQAQFDAKLSDPIAALKWLAEQPAADAQPVARPGIAKIVSDDLAAGLKAFSEGKADVVEKHLVRAALLADAYSPEFSKQLMRMLFLLKQPRKTPTGCGTCKGLGSSACGACKSGLAQGPCPRCEAKGQVNCLLCDGSGQMDHHGFKGKMVLTFSDFKVKVAQGTGTIHGQVVNWHMAACANGSFSLRTDNTITCEHKNDPRVKPTTFSGSKSCNDLYKELKLYAFNGKCKIQVQGRQGQLITLKSAAARRFFSDYENCKSGSLGCDRCAGRKTDPCGVCTGKGQAQLLCTGCEGTSLKACGGCKGYGDAAWVAKLLPADGAPGLVQSLNEQAVAIRDWLDARARTASRKDDLARRLEEAKKGLDPTAKLTPDYVDIVCPRCKANGSECEECWATGRREYYEGTGQYERYALVQKLERQIKESAQPPSTPAFGAVSTTEAAAAGGAKPPPPPPPVPRVGPMVAVPKTVEEILKKADELHETGKAHLEKSKALGDGAGWVEEAVLAVTDLKNAQTLYATAQEKLDEAGASVPRELLAKFRTNMQALVMARKQVP